MSFSRNYNLVDRALHRFAFCSPFVQKVLSELESDLFRSELETVTSRREVFVTGLPRAGTTLILELLYGTREFGTYTYRNMPFILAPLLWAKVSRSFQRAGERRERAHGDRMEISFDSPEAFEEVVWLTYLGREILSDETLATLSSDAVTENSRTAIRESVRKVLALAKHANQASADLRYLSKNNANISRIDVLLELFPTSDILVLYRNPLGHISSLARQHQRFLGEHASEPFSRAYMRWIGHYEFGENLKPINFHGWLDEGLPPDIDATFWLRYWSFAYAYALEHKTDRVHFVDFDQLLEDREASLQRIAQTLDLTRKHALVDSAGALRSPTTRPLDPDAFPSAVCKHANDIHARLKSLAV